MTGNKTRVRLLIVLSSFTRVALDSPGNGNGANAARGVIITKEYRPAPEATSKRARACTTLAPNIAPRTAKE